MGEIISFVDDTVTVNTDHNWIDIKTKTERDLLEIKNYFDTICLLSILKNQIYTFHSI